MKKETIINTSSMSMDRYTFQHGTIVTVTTKGLERVVRHYALSANKVAVLVQEIRNPEPGVLSRVLNTAQEQDSLWPTIEHLTIVQAKAGRTDWSHSTKTSSEKERERRMNGYS